MATEAGSNMQMKVGDLARRTGVTVRTLHHYDEIGLLTPSGRSESGYRLYSGGDVARLHGIQALRHLGLSLHDIASLLDGHGAQPRDILRQQLQALERQIAQAKELQAKLVLIQDTLVQGEQPKMNDWLEVLALMTTFGKYFSADELRTILEGWRSVEAWWHSLLERMRAAMDAGLAPDSIEIQPLAQEWIALAFQALDGDFKLMNRWDEMYRLEPGAHGRLGAPPSDMLDFARRAVEFRLGLMRKYLTQEEIERCRPLSPEQWRALEREAAQLMDQGVAAASPEARAIARRGMELLLHQAGGDPAIRMKLMGAFHCEPMLRAGSSLRPEVRAWILQALDPHVT